MFSADLFGLASHRYMLTESKLVNTIPAMSQVQIISQSKDKDQGMTHYMNKSMWTPARLTSHSKIMVINMDLVPPLLL